MAAKSLIDLALEDINRQMDDLHRAKQILLNSMDKAVKVEAAAPPKVRKPRGPNKRRAGLPAAAGVLPMAAGAD